MTFFKAEVTLWWMLKALFDGRAPRGRAPPRWVPPQPPLHQPLPRAGSPLPFRGQLLVLVIARSKPSILPLASVKICVTKPSARAHFGDGLHQEPYQSRQKLG